MSMSFSRLTVESSSAALRALAACVRTLLGPQHTLKLAHASETEPALLTSDALAVLSALDVEASAAGALLLEACEGQHSAHGCGALKFLMFPRATAVPGWQYCPGGQGTGRRRFAPYAT